MIALKQCPIRKFKAHCLELTEHPGSKDDQRRVILFGRMVCGKTVAWNPDSASSCYVMWDNLFNLTEPQFSYS